MIYDNPTRAAQFLSGPIMELCTPSEMADYLGIDDSTIRQAIRRGKLETGRDCFLLGKQWILSRHAWAVMCGDYQKFSTLCVECRRTVATSEE